MRRDPRSVGLQVLAGAFGAVISLGVWRVVVAVIEAIERAWPW